MDEQAPRRFEVVVEEGLLRGDLYALEQTTCFRVVNRLSGQTVLTFEGRLEAGLSTDTGQWEDFRASGVCAVTIAEDERSVLLKYHDGHEETVRLESGHNMRRDELLKRIRDARARWEGALEALDDAALVQPGFAGDWSAKDVIAHIAWHEREMIGMIRARALVGSELWLLRLHERNDAIYRANCDRSSAEVRREAEVVYAGLLEALETLSDQDLVDPGHFPGMPVDWQPWQVIAGNTFEHYLDHLPVPRT